MTPAIGYVIAGLLAAAPLAHDAGRTRTQVNEVIYECPPTYSLATNRRGEVICLRYRRDLAR